MSLPLPLPPVYAITDRAAAGLADHAAIVARLLSAGVRCIQVREKESADRDLLDALERSARLAREAGALLFVNDRADLARVVGVGVHLGADDLPAREARRLLGPDAPLGVSTHSLAEAAAAFAAPEPDYVAFGPVFASATKTDLEPRGLEALARVAAGKTRPLVAVGGIGPETLDSVLDAGADSAAMARGLLAGGRIEENARRALDVTRRRALPGRVYLVGFMGSGKTTVGRRVAERLQVPFVDLDAEIERTSGKTVRALFESVGEPAFRELESTFLEATRSLPHAVVATGGGGYVREENRRAIASLGTAVFLDVPLTVLLERLADKTDRPLFTSAEQAAALAAEREPCYRMGSIPVALRLESPEEAADRVLLALDARKRSRLFEP